MNADLPPYPARKKLAAIEKVIDQHRKAYWKAIELGKLTEHQAERLRSRLRQKDATLVCWGSWPRCEARLSVRSSVWTGLGAGHGRLAGRQVSVDVIRGNAPRRSFRLWLPGADQEVVAAGAPVVGLDQVMAG